MSNSQEQRLQAAADRVELGELLHRYCWAIDKWEWQLLDQVFTEDAEVDYSSVGKYVAGDTVLRGRKAIVNWLRESIAVSGHPAFCFQPGGRAAGDSFPK